MAKLALLGLFASVSPSRMSRRITRIESEKSGICHSKIVHSYSPHTFNHCLPCGYGFNPVKKGDGGETQTLLTIRHVFGGSLEGRMEKPESGIRNRNRNRSRSPNLRNKTWRRFCLKGVTNNYCSIKTFHPHIIFIYCYYIFYCRIFCVRRKIFSSRISYMRERCNLGS